MIYLDINIPKDVVATLNEKAVGSNPYYIWKIKDADTNTEYIFTNDDTSPSPWYYNQFTFSVIPGATYGLTAGIIPASQGEYIYNVYQTSVAYDITLSNIIKEVENGILNIEGTTSVINQVNFTNNIIPTLKNL